MAIQALDHEAIYKAHPEIVTISDVFETYGLDKDGNQVTFDQAKVNEQRVLLDAGLAATQYQRDRKEEYPSIEDQLDMIYWDKMNSTTKFKEAISKVKTDNPKT